MGTNRTSPRSGPRLRRLAAACGCLLGGLLALPEAARAGEVEVITGPGITAPTDRNALRNIFLMRVRQWPGGTPVRVFVMPENSDIHDQFSRERLGTYPYVLNQAWNRLVFTGTGLAPETVKSDQEMRDKVNSTPGAIGYRRNDPRSGRHASFAFANEGGSGASH